MEDDVSALEFDEGVENRAEPWAGGGELAVNSHPPGAVLSAADKAPVHAAPPRRDPYEDERAQPGQHDDEDVPLGLRIRASQGAAFQGRWDGQERGSSQCSGSRGLDDPGAGAGVTSSQSSAARPKKPRFVAPRRVKEASPAPSLGGGAASGTGGWPGGAGPSTPWDNKARHGTPGFPGGMGSSQPKLPLVPWGGRGGEAGGGGAAGAGVGVGAGGWPLMPARAYVPPRVPGPAGRLLAPAGAAARPDDVPAAEWHGGGGGGLVPAELDPAHDPAFGSAPWQDAMAALDAPASPEAFASCPLFQHNVGRILRDCWTDVVPQLVVYVSSLKRGRARGEDAAVGLRDPTGEMRGAVDGAVVEGDARVRAGAVLLLRRPGVFNPSVRAHYLCISLENIAQVFPPAEGGEAGEGWPPKAVDGGAGSAGGGWTGARGCGGGGERGWEPPRGGEEENDIAALLDNIDARQRPPPPGPKWEPQPAGPHGGGEENDIAALLDDIEARQRPRHPAPLPPPGGGGAGGGPRGAEQGGRGGEWCPPEGSEDEDDVAALLSGLDG